MPECSNKPVGLIPAAGRATRIAPLPCSKEIFPIGQHAGGQQRAGRVRAACDWLLEGMHQAGARKAYIVLSPGKWDVAAYLGDGSDCDLHLAYLQIRDSAGVPHTANQAVPFVENNTVLFGFPDIVFEPTDVFSKLLDAYQRSEADVVLSLFPAHSPHKMDMVRLDPQGRLVGIDIKPPQTALTHTWLHAVWSPAFSRYLHRFIRRSKSLHDELHMGHVFVDALQNGVVFHTVLFDQHRYIDIGTPEDLAAAVDQYSDR